MSLNDDILLFTAYDEGVFIVINILYPVVWSQKTSEPVHQPSNEGIVEFETKTKRLFCEFS